MILKFIKVQTELKKSLQKGIFYFLNMLFLIIAGCSHDKKSADMQFKWENVLIGGGGYVTGLVIHPDDPDVWYIRTDVGAAYRWNGDEKQLHPITDWISIENANLYGVSGMVLIPDNPDIIYVAAGRYPFASPSDVLVSHDRGETWEKTGLDKSFGSNRHPEKLAEKLVINPHDPNYLWCGTMGDGLWIYNRQNQEWKRNEAFDTTANIQTIEFHPGLTDIAFVVLRDKGIFRTTDGGKTFSKIENSPTDVADVAVSSDGEFLYTALLSGGIHALEDPVKKNKWKDISPVAGAEYRCITSDPHVPGGVAVIVKMMDGLRDGFWYSRNHGNNWQKKYAEIEQVIPWHGDNYPGAAASTIVFDPLDTARVFITDWYSVFVTNNFRDDTVYWSNKAGVGHEELVCLNLAAPPANNEGVALYSAHADVGGFAHQDLMEYPSIVFRRTDGSLLKNVTGLDFCESNPERVYRIGAVDHKGTEVYFSVSDDFGKTWTIMESYNMDWKWGRVAVSPTDPLNVVVATVDGGVRYTLDGGKTFLQPDQQVPTGLRGPVFRYGYPLEADKVNGSVFYLYSRDEQAFFASYDKGKSWEKIFDSLPVPDPRYFKNQLDDDFFNLISIPGMEGHLFLALADEGLLHSTDSGYSWHKLDNVKEAPMVAAGKAFQGDNYPALYMLGKLQKDNELWYYLSRDEGKSWIKINNNKTRIGNNPEVMAADRQQQGRVFVGTNGSGVIMGEIFE